MSEKMHWMPFNINDWLSSGTVQAMPFKRQGIYLAMLARCWSFASCSLVADPEMILDQLPGKKDSEDLDEVRIILKSCFVPHPELPDRVINEVQYSLFLKQSSKLKANKENGKKGGLAKASKVLAPLESRSRITSNSLSYSDLSLKNKKELSIPKYQEPDPKGNPRLAHVSFPNLFFSDAELTKLAAEFRKRGLRSEFCADAYRRVSEWFTDSEKGRKEYPKSSNHARRVLSFGCKSALENQAASDRAAAAQARANVPTIAPQPNYANRHERRILKAVQAVGGAK